MLVVQNQKVSKWRSVSHMQAAGRFRLTYMALVWFKVFNQLCKTLDFYENWKVWPPPPTGATIWQRGAGSSSTSSCENSTWPSSVSQGPASAIISHPIHFTNLCCLPGPKSHRVWDCSFRYIIKWALEKLDTHTLHSNASKCPFSTRKTGQTFFPTSIKHPLDFRLCRNVKCINYYISYFITIFCI